MRKVCAVVVYFTIVFSGLALFVQGRYITFGAARTKLAQAIYLQFPVAERMRCAARGHRLKVDSDLLASTVAIADVESYARPRWVRLAQSSYVLGNYYVLDRIPDISIGPAQIKPSNIAKIIPPRSDMSQWIQFVSDECAGLSIAYCFVHGLRMGHNLHREDVAAIARLYNGQGGSSGTESSL